jgi:hypothetical protein
MRTQSHCLLHLQFQRHHLPSHPSILTLPTQIILGRNSDGNIGGASKQGSCLTTVPGTIIILGDSSLARCAGATCSEAFSQQPSHRHHDSCLSRKSSWQTNAARRGSSRNLIYGGEDSFTGASETAQAFTFYMPMPPPSYWIGLGQPPPALDWQQFGNTMGRSRPPPKPNVCHHPWYPPTLTLTNPPSNGLDYLLSIPIQSLLPPFPPISTNGGSLQFIIPSSTCLHLAINGSFLAYTLLFESF